MTHLVEEVLQLAVAEEAGPRPAGRREPEHQDYDWTLAATDRPGEGGQYVHIHLYRSQIRDETGWTLTVRD